jgi:hypothetical protein
VREPWQSDAKRCATAIHRLRALEPDPVSRTDQV